MADARLIERLAGGVFDPPVAFRDLAEYHLDFASLGGASPEAELRERAERPAGCCTVLGRGGSGKSSLIAAVTASLAPRRFPVRVQGVNSDAALTREGFALHVAHETLRALDASAGGHARGGRTGVATPLPRELHNQLSATVHEVIEGHNAASIAQGIEELVEVTGDFERRLLLVVEDTDVFMPPDPVQPGERERARRFADNVLTYLAREFPASSMVAINVRYRDLIPRATVATVDVPSLQPAAIALLIEHYALQSGIHLNAADVIEPEALAYVAGRYAETQDIRRTLELLHRAARKMAGEDRGERITVEVLHGL